MQSGGGGDGGDPDKRKPTKIVLRDGVVVRAPKEKDEADEDEEDAFSPSRTLAVETLNEDDYGEDKDAEMQEAEQGPRGKD